MKKVKHLIACLLIACTAISLNSCETVNNVLSNQQTQQLLGALITNLVGQRGAIYAYTGKGTNQLLTLKTGTSDYAEGSKKADFVGTVNLTANNTVANIVIPDMAVGTGTMTGMRINGLVMETASNGTKLSIGEQSTIDGNYHINGADMKPSNLYIDAIVTNQQLKVTLMSIYFGENGEKVVNLTFDGTTAQK